jgi:hypothetical protein
MISSNNITSIIDSGNCQEAFNKILHFVDPNKAKNRKTKLLDCAMFISWTETDHKIFDIVKTRNLQNLVTTNKFDIIVYAPPDNKTFIANATQSSKYFSKIINIGGSIIAKIKDFNELNNGNNELKGHFDMKTIFESNDFYLENQVIFKNPRSFNQDNSNDNQIVHQYFMIFKKRNPNN